ncbi:MAG: divergent polysaccharide deacetylase family protein, partial [Vulcanimicrobiaceae bacterium]
MAPIALLLFAALAGWWLLRPRAHVPRHGPTPRATAATITTAAPEQPTPTTQPSATPSAAPSPSPSGAPTSQPSEHPAAGMTANPATSRARLAIIIDDCGQWLKIERGFIALPVPITLSVLPDVHGTHEIASEAAAAGKGVMLHLPMETLSGLYPGPGEITTEMTNAQIDRTLRADLAQVPLAQGVNNHEGSKATADPRVMHDVAEILATKNLFFVDS